MEPAIAIRRETECAAVRRVFVLIRGEFGFRGEREPGEVVGRAEIVRGYPRELASIEAIPRPHRAKQLSDPIELGRTEIRKWCCRRHQTSGVQGGQATELYNHSRKASRGRFFKDTSCRPAFYRETHAARRWATVSGGITRKKPSAISSSSPSKLIS